MKYTNLFIFIFILYSNINAQFVNVDITSNKDRLQKSLTNELNEFENNLKNYFLFTDFAPDAMDIEFSMKLHFIFLINKHTTEEQDILLIKQAQVHHN